MPSHLIGLAFFKKATDYLDSMPPGKIRAQVAKKASQVHNRHYFKITKDYRAAFKRAHNKPCVVVISTGWIHIGWEGERLKPFRPGKVLQMIERLRVMVTQPEASHA